MYYLFIFDELLNQIHIMKRAGLILSFKGVDQNPTPCVPSNK